MKFESPLFLIFLLAIPLFVILKKFVSRKGIPFSSISFSLPKTFRVRTAFIPELLMLIAFIFFVLALARPQAGKEISRKVTGGLAIEMVIDRSSSMDQPINRRRNKNRLDMVKEVFSRFVLGDGESLEGRQNDMIGIVSFAGYADTLSPLTLSYNVMPQFIAKLNLVQTREEDGTAIGDAIALAAARLHRLDITLKDTNETGKTNYKVKGKVMILLTDGENNQGDYQPLEAAKLAAEWGIKIYTIGIVGSPTMLGELFGNNNQHFEKILQDIAKETGGAYFAAEDSRSLLAIYKEIDTLEKTDIEKIEYAEYKELFLPFLLVGLFAFALSTILRSLYYRRID